MPVVRRRLFGATAAAVISNWPHFAVALVYESGKMRARVCVAKGVDLTPCDVDESIKPEHFKAVAQVIGYVMRLKNKLAQRRTESRR